MNLRNQTERALGPFEIWFSGDANGERAFMVNGLQTMVRLLWLGAIISNMWLNIDHVIY